MELPNNPGEASAYANGVADARRAVDAEIAKLQAEVASLKAALAVRADNDRLIREFSEQRESDEQLGHD